MTRQATVLWNGPGSLHAAVYFLPVPHFHHQDEEGLVPNLVDGSVILSRPYPNTVELLFRFELLHPMRTRILLQMKNIVVHLFSNNRIKLPDVSLSGGSDFNAVCQDSVSQFAHELPQWDSPFFFGLFQGGVGILDVLAVHFLAGQTVQ